MPKTASKSTANTNLHKAKTGKNDEFNSHFMLKYDE